MILVTGATGTVGREVVSQLVAAGQKVRVLTRDPAKATFPAGVEVVAGDLGKPDSLAKAFEGVEKAFSLAAGADIAVHEGNVAQAAKRAGAKHLVKLSVMGAGMGNTTNPVLGWHDAGEKAIRESGLAWTMVRPGMFMSNARQWVPTIKATGKVFLPYGDGKVVPIHPRDIAAVAVKALTSSGHEGKEYTLTGSEALGLKEQIKILSDALGKPIEYVAVPEEAAREGMKKAGMPPLLIEGLSQMGALIRNGGAGTVLPTLQTVLGRPGITWREWVRENLTAFQ